MKKPILTASEAIDLIKDDSMIIFEGFIGIGHAEELTATIEKKFLEVGHPKNLSIMFCAGQGDAKDKGLNHLAHDGLIKRAIGGHYNLVPKIGKMAVENRIEAYNFPQGVLSHLVRDIASGGPGVVTRIGTSTYCDPRVAGGKMNDLTKEDLVELVNLRGKEHLLYHSFPIDVALIRGTTADEDGNITMEKEILILETLSACQAARNSGGIVIAQVERIAKSGTLKPKDVIIPGMLVDAIVVASDPEYQWQLFNEAYNPAYIGEIKVPNLKLPPIDLNERKVIARRCFMEIGEAKVVNLGIGVPEGVANVAEEENVLDQFVLTVESGSHGGVPVGGLKFGVSINPECIMRHSDQFDFLDGGGVDVTVLGMAELDKRGNVNVSKFGTRLAGCGGFIDISQGSKKVVFCGAFTAKGLELAVGDGQLKIIQEGEICKIVEAVQHTTYSGDYAIKERRDVIYVTERAVFKLDEEGLLLIEIAPGIDLEKDILALMNFKPIISKNLKLMDSRIFYPDLMNL